MTTFLREVSPRTTLVFHQPLYGVDSYRAKSMTLVRRLSRETGLPVRFFDCQRRLPRHLDRLAQRPPRPAAR